MIVKNPEQYTLIGFNKSKTKNKKYDGILQNKSTGRIKKVPFGDIRYQHYFDAVPLKLYSHLNHNDPNRRRLYRLRHKGEEKKKFSSGYFSFRYLW